MIHYRSIKGYKYQLLVAYSINVGIRGYDCGNDYVRLSNDGTLHIANNYAWDGPSGPSIATADFMRGSLVHDALYQLMRTDLLPKVHRKLADIMLKKICLEDGMPYFRANYVYYGVRLFGGLSIL